MTTNHSTPRPHLLTGYPAALVIIAVTYILGLAASTYNSSTFDEGIHLAGGYIHLTLGQPRIHTENGYLSQAIAALPLLLIHPNLPNQAGRAFQEAQPFDLGREFLYSCNNDPAQLLLLGRAAIGLLTAATALTIYIWGRKLFSPLAGIFSLLLFSLAPITLSHGFLATSDMPATFFFTLSLAAFWHTLQKITPLRFIFSALALAALFLSKMSAPIMLPVLVLLIVIRCSKPAPVSSFRVHRLPFINNFIQSIALLLAQVLAVYILIWAAYGFTYSAFKDSPAATLPALAQTFWPPAGWKWALSNPNPLLNVIAFGKDHHLLPEAYLYGYAYVTQTSDIARHSITFAAGMRTIGGWWWFFPFAFLITTPLPILLIMCLTAILSLRQFIKLSSSSRWRNLGKTLYSFAPLLLFLLIYWLAAICSYRSSGTRHTLPAYPALCLLVGSLTAFLLTRFNSCILFKFKLKLFSLAVAALYLSLAVTTFLSFPCYLSFFNSLIGGPSNGYRYLVDSTLDWGQDLPALETYLKNNNTAHQRVYLAYFGSADPNAYVHADVLPSVVERPEENAAADSPLQPGLYCISVTLLQNLFNENTNFTGGYTPKIEEAYQSLLHDALYAGYLKSHLDKVPPLTEQDKERIADTPRLLRDIQFVRLCAYLRSREPRAQAGYSINIYNLTQGDLNEALNGPPPY